jgi:hypothetical protein
VGLATAGGLAEISAGVLGPVATWVASTGSRAAGREAQTPRLAGRPVFFWGARCAAWPVVKAPPQKKRRKTTSSNPEVTKILSAVSRAGG